MYNHHLYPVLNFFTVAKGNLVSNYSPLSCLEPMTTTNLLPVLMGLSIQDILYEWNLTKYGPLCLFLLSIIFLKFTYVVL